MAGVGYAPESVPEERRGDSRIVSMFIVFLAPQ